MEAPTEGIRGLRTFAEVMTLRWNSFPFALPSFNIISCFCILQLSRFNLLFLTVDYGIEDKWGIRVYVLLKVRFVELKLLFAKINLGLRNKKGLWLFFILWDYDFCDWYCSKSGLTWGRTPKGVHCFSTAGLFCWLICAYVSNERREFS